MAKNHCVGSNDVPSCRSDCKDLGSDFMSDYSPPFYFCGLNVFTPTKNQKYKKQAIDFIKSNGWGSDYECLQHGIEYWTFDKDGCYSIDVSDDEIVLIDDTGDFLHINLGENSTYALLGALIYNRQLAMNFKEW